MRFFKFVAIAAVSALAAFGTVAAQGLAIKEYELGAPMTSCPSNSLATNSNGPETVCMLGSTTLANRPVQMVTVGFYQGKVSSAHFRLRSGGQYANGDVLEALKEKFGPPNADQAHLNRYSWYRDSQSLSFDGWDGYVLLSDRDAYKKIRTEKAAKDKSDL